MLKKRMRRFRDVTGVPRLYSVYSSRACMASLCLERVTFIAASERAFVSDEDFVKITFCDASAQRNGESDCITLHGHKLRDRRDLPVA